MFLKKKKKHRALDSGNAKLLGNCSKPDPEGIKCRWPLRAPLMPQGSVSSHLDTLAPGFGGGLGTPVLARLTFTHTFRGLGTLFPTKTCFMAALLFS